MNDQEKSEQHEHRTTEPERIPPPDSSLNDMPDPLQEDIVPEGEPVRTFDRPETGYEAGKAPNIAAIALTLVILALVVFLMIQWVF